MRRIASLLAVALLAGCAGAAPSSPQAPHHEDANVHETAPQTVTLGVGERATLADGSQLTYLRLVNDSRCPPDVQCVWAGDASIELEWRPGTGASRTLTLHLNPQAGPDRAALDGRSVAFTALARDTARASLQVTRTP